MGICTWSPRLDALGNSVRGIEFCKRLIGAFNFHNYDGLLNLTGIGKQDPRKKRNADRNHVLVELCFAASQGDLGKVKRMKLAGVDLNQADYDSRTALHLAAAEGHDGIVKFILTHVPEMLNHVDRWGGTALNDAYRESQMHVAEVLRSYGGLTGEELGTIVTTGAPPQ